MKKENKKKFVVIRDSSEKVGHGWTFVATASCTGTVIKKLKYADYTVDGLQAGIFLIERKKNPSEVHKNLIGKDYIRFEKELIELNKIKHAYIILEFDMATLLRYKRGSISGRFLIHKIFAMSEKFPNIDIIYAGRCGQEVAGALFKRMVALYPEKVIWNETEQ